MKRPRHLFAYLAIAVAVVVAGALALRHLQPRQVTVAQPRRGPAVEAVYATGTVESSVMLPIAPRITARLAELEADEGDRVHKGDVIARLEDSDLRHALAQLRSQEAFAKSEYDRNAVLVKSGVIARTVFDRARADWQAASAASTRAAAELGYATLTAPADGTITRRDGEVGQLIAVNQAVFWISVDSPLRISAEVDEEDVARVAVGQEALIRADAFPERVFHGRVQAITPKGDPVARSYRVRIALDDETPLRVGMTAETNIVIRRNDSALLVPHGAVQGNHVWRVSNGRLEQRPVVVGADGKEAVEILQGVAAGDLVVTDPDASLVEGQAVRTIAAGAGR